MHRNIRKCSIAGVRWNQRPEGALSAAPNIVRVVVITIGIISLLHYLAVF
jgi:hypothetical protein